MNQRVIKLLGEPIQNEDHACDEALLPGHLVERNSDGTVGKQSTAAANVPLLIVLEREEMGQGTDGAYAIGDKVKIGAFGKGQRFSGWIASGQNLTVDDGLEADGAGGFRLLASGVRIGNCLENTGAITVATRIAIEAM